ncbi:unnamed protein product [Cunninghamella echinulata]
MCNNLKWHSSSSTDYPLKRKKVTKACQGCRIKKMKCDGFQPCQRCKKDKKHCKYEPSPSLSSFKTNRTEKGIQQTETNFNWQHLFKITFTHDLFASIIRDQTTTTSTTRCPPLLFDFYHITCHSNKIWSTLEYTFQEWYQQQSLSLKPIPFPIKLMKEALLIFSKYNTLYSLFIKVSDLDIVLNHAESYFPIFSPFNKPTSLSTTYRHEKKKMNIMIHYYYYCYYF